MKTTTEYVMEITYKKQGAKKKAYVSGEYLEWLENHTSLQIQDADRKNILPPMYTDELDKAGLIHSYSWAVYWLDQPWITKRRDPGGIRPNSMAVREVRKTIHIELIEVEK